MGLVSGGCLEADIRLNARKVLAFNEPRCLLYDSTEEGNIATELGLGCNGRVEVLVQPLRAESRQLLLTLLERMTSGRTSYLLQCFRSSRTEDLNALALLDEAGKLLMSNQGAELPAIPLTDKAHQVVQDGRRVWSLNRHAHAVRLWICGGGIDARPMANLAASLGWLVTLADHRPAYAKAADFPAVQKILRQRPEEAEEIDADAAILMSHNLRLDAAWLARLSSCESLRYLGILGPVDRRNEALKLAGIAADAPLLNILHGPMGFAIGGDMPETVALSTLAQCHQVLFAQETGRSR